MYSTSPPVHRTPLKLFDPWSRVLSVVPLSEFQRFWDNSNVSRHILGPPRRQRQRWKMPPWSLSLHCPYSLISSSLWLALPPWCVVSAWENAGLSGCYVLRRRPQRSRGVLLEPSVPVVGLTVANTQWVRSQIWMQPFITAISSSIYSVDRAPVSKSNALVIIRVRQNIIVNQEILFVAQGMLGVNEH